MFPFSNPQLSEISRDRALYTSVKETASLLELARVAGYRTCSCYNELRPYLKTNMILAKAVQCREGVNMKKSKGNNIRGTPKQSIEHKIFRRAVQTVSRANSDGSISILNLEDNKFYYRITDTTTEIWNDLDGKRTLRQTLADIATRHKSDYRKVCGGAERPIKNLLKLKLIELV